MDSCIIEWFKQQPSNIGVGMVQQLNCQITQGSGVAARIRKEFPTIYAADVKFGRSGDITKLGLFCMAEVLPNKYCYGYFGQFKYGLEKRHTNYEAVYSGLENIKIDAISRKITKLGIPNKMGCARGGGDFRIVNAMIDVIFEFCNIDVYICNYDPDKTPAKPILQTNDFFNIEVSSI